MKAIGWWLEEEGMAQISMNLTDFRTTNLHQAFEECEKDAKEINVSLCGSQIVGLIPLEAILAAADHYIKKEGLLVLEEANKVKLVRVVLILIRIKFILINKFTKGHSKIRFELNITIQS